MGMKSTTLEDVRLWARKASRDQLDRALKGMQAERELRRSQPITDYKGRPHRSENHMGCAFNGCRGCSKCYVPSDNPVINKGWSR